MKTQTLLEVVQSTNPQVDAEKGVIRDVRILGAKSANGREYTREAIANAAGLYEGKRVYCDHPRPGESPTAERSIRDRVGWLENVREHDGGLNGDLHLWLSDPVAPKILEAAAKKPDQFGLSHNAEGRVAKRDGKILVEEIKAVRSVDIVDDPATTRGLFESIQSEPEAEPNGMKTTLGKLLEQLAPKHEDAKTWSKLIEEEIPAIADAPVEVAGDAPSEEDQVDAAFKAMVMAVLDNKELNTAAKKKKIGEILNAQDKLTSDDGGKDSEESADGETPESIQRQMADMQAQLDVRQMADDAGVRLSKTQVKAMVPLSESERKEMIADAKRLCESTGGTQVPKPDSRGQSLQESGDFQEPKDTEEFVRAIT